MPQQKLNVLYVRHW